MFQRNAKQFSIYVVNKKGYGNGDSESRLVETSREREDEEFPVTLLLDDGEGGLT